jgi:tetratricopeptide (TPR) repeat protein
MTASGQRNNTAGLGLGVSPWHYLLTQCDALVLYARLCLWPAPLIYDYGTPIIKDWVEVWWQGTLVLGALGGSVYALVRHPRVGFAAALVFAVLAPSSSFVPVITQTMGEQRMYLPSAALLVLLGLAVYRILGAKTPAVLALAAVSGAAASHLRVQDYATEERIWIDVTEKLPGSPRGYANLLHEWIQQGRDEEAMRTLPDFVRRLGDHDDGKEPFDPDAHTAQLMALMGSAYVDIGKIDVALDLYRRAAVLAPENQLAQFNSAKLLFDLKRHEEALPYLDAFLGLKPEDTEALQMYGRCLMLTGQPARAEVVLARLIQLAPSDLEARLDHADSVILQENYVEGARLYRELRGLAPRHPRVVERIAQLTSLLSSSREQ